MPRAKESTAQRLLSEVTLVDGNAGRGDGFVSPGQRCRGRDRCGDRDRHREQRQTQGAEIDAGKETQEQRDTGAETDAGAPRASSQLPVQGAKGSTHMSRP